MNYRVLGGMLLLLPTTIPAQAAPAAARSFFAAYSRGDWTAMAAQVDSPSLAALRAEATKLAETMSRSREITDRMRADSTRSPVLQAMQGLEAMLGPNLLAMTFARVTSEAELTALSDRELMSRWFEAKGPANLARMGRAMVGSMLPAEAMGSADSVLAAMLAKPVPWEVVGELTEQAGQSHVVYRAGGETPGATGVLTFRQATDSRWLLSFSRTDDQLATFASYAMRAQLPAGSPGIR